MWRKILRSEESLNYRKKYKCPVCKEYSLRIIHDLACECEHDCDVEDNSNKEIKKIIENNDFKGYYTLQDIDNLFNKIDNNKVNKLFKKITDDPLLKGMSDEQKNEIENLYSKTIKIDSLLDDVTVKYKNKYCIKECDDLTSFSYVINLVEDVHHFLNLAWNDIGLFYYGSNLVKEKFYTERFFFDNCVDHISASEERIYVFLGIYYDFKFSTNLSVNRTMKIKQYLKTQRDFKNSEMKRLLKVAAETSIINKIRGKNIHDLSYINNKIITDIEKNRDKAELYNADSTKIYKSKLKPDLPKILKSINKYYDVLFEIIKIIGNNNFNDKNIPMLEIFWKDIINVAPVETQYSYDFIHNLEEKSAWIFDRIMVLEKYNVDVFFRINDIIHCITDIYNIETGFYFERYKIDEKESKFIFQVDKQYLLYIASIRLYSCYDKLSKYLNGFDNRYKDIKYFSNFSSFTFSKNNDYDQKIENIITNKYFQRLEDLRNNIYHSLRPGCMGGKVAMQHFNNVIMQVVFENTRIVLDFLVFIIENN